MRDITSEYNRKKQQIKCRLKEFRNLRNANLEDIFSELCFCILTPQSRALCCNRAVEELKKSDLLLRGRRRAVKSKLKGVRFPNNKSAYLVAARKFFINGKKPEIMNMLNIGNALKARDWLVKNIKGIGYKEASHFLRNIGLGQNMAILDVHILRNLKNYKVINKIPSSISKRTYLDIEDKMREFSKTLKIPLEELDLLFWSNQTGFIFK